MNLLLRSVISILLLPFIFPFTINSNEPFKFKAENLKKPEIWLSSYMTVDSFDEVSADKEFRSHEQFQNYYVSKNGSDFVIFRDETQSIVFTCVADYHISWKFPYPTQWDSIHYYSVETRDFQTSKFHPNDREPTTVQFKSQFILTVANVDFLSANLTCASTKTTTQSSVYIYLKASTIFEHQGETLQVFANPLSNRQLISGKLGKVQPVPIVLPCRPASPELQVILEKNVNPKRDKWTVINPGDKILLSFDPKNGFTLQGGLFGKRILGLYRCSLLAEEPESQVVSFNSDNTKNNYVYFIVSNTKDDTVATQTTFQSLSTLEGNASFRLQVDHSGYHTETSVICCTGIAEIRPDIYMSECNDPFQCTLLKEYYAKTFPIHHDIMFPTPVNVANDCQKSPIFGSSVVIQCLGRNIKFREHLIGMFHPLAAIGPVANRSSRIFKAENGYNATQNKSQTVSLTNFENVTSLGIAPTSQKMILFVGQEFADSLDWEDGKDFGPGLYFGDTPAHFYQYIFTFEQDGAFMPTIHSSVHFVEYERDVYYEGEFMSFMCSGPKYIYAQRGAQLKLVWRNGTNTILDNFNGAFTNELIPTRYIVNLWGKVDMFDGYTKHLTSTFWASLRANLDMLWIECWMPLRSNGEWEMVSKHLQILPNVAPKFREAVQENLYFYLGDVDKMISCVVVEGLPQPNVQVTKDRSIMNPIHENENTTGLNVTSVFVERVDTKKGDVVINATIFLPVINHKSQGVFRCTATNINCTVTRTINVFVIEKPGVLLPVFVSFTVILSLVLVGFGIWHWRNRKSVQTLVARRI